MKPPELTVTDILIAEASDWHAINISGRNRNKRRIRQISKRSKDSTTTESEQARLTEETNSILQLGGIAIDRAAKQLMNPKSPGSSDSAPSLEEVVSELTKGKSKLK